MEIIDFWILLKKVQEAIQAVVPAGLPVYLVGGALRDLLLSSTVHDLDFVLSGDVLGYARRIANHLEGAYYPMDPVRKTARVILIDVDGNRTLLDFSEQRGAALLDDLLRRDFTINAIALSMNNLDQVIDPLRGAADLRQKVLRTCSDTSMQADPVRVLRAIRLAVDLELKLLPETKQQILEAASLLPEVSPERMRDELFRILESTSPDTAMRLFDHFGLIQYVLPELQQLKGVTQSKPHVLDVWEHTLAVLNWLERILEVLGVIYDEESSSNLSLGLVSMQIGRYRQQIHNHLNVYLNVNRSPRGLLCLAALYHDVAKPQTRQVEPGGRIRFFEHDQIGAEVITHRASELHFSNDEIHRLALIVRHHMRPLLLSQGTDMPSRRSVYRFFRDVDVAGIDIALLSLADTLATYGPDLPQALWARQLEVVRMLMEAWWEHPEKQVAPVALVNGNDVMKIFDLPPGRHIGEILEAVREAQASGEVNSRQEALDLASRIVEKNRLDNASEGWNSLLENPQG
jgi:putative nucleotidyltransferase with HDIG domain